METVYLRDGSSVILHEELSKGFVIEKICLYHGWEGEEVEEPSGIKEVVDSVFKKPPSPVFSKQIEQARKTLETINCDISESRKENSGIQSEVRSAKKEYSELLSTLKKVPVLKNIERIMNEDVVYFAYLTGWRNKYSIKKINDTYCDEGDSYDRGMKLLSLFGDSKGDFSYRLHQYKDGSGNYEEVIPCYTIDEAKELIRQHVLKEMKTRTEGNNHFYGFAKEVEFMDGNGFDFPDQYREAHNKYIEKNRLQQIESLTKTLNQTQDNLDKLNKE